ncbi:universal stress protein [Nocardia sp. NPDC058114]|uniref:universal stress protein n=1 Tax=Nocardia sp. NPDC058114 TaxID=3346346 RepID=UPI0036D986B9
MTSNSDPEPAQHDWRTPTRVDGPAGPRPPSSHLVVGFDRHHTSHAALEFAIGLAGQLNAHLHVAHVIDTDDLPIDSDAADWDHAITAVIEHERDEACSRLAALGGNWTYHCHHGQPAHVLSSIAETHDAAMIVIGTPRAGLMPLVERLLGGSVSAQLIHHSHRPVLLVPDRTTPTTGQ